MELAPRLIFWEITQKCNLACLYCRRQDYSASPSKEEAIQIIDSIIQDYSPLLIFSGGEPLLHAHLFEIALYARQRGLKTALATNATLINPDSAKKIKSAHFHRVAVSLDSIKEEINDSLRGKGVFQRTIKGIECLKQEDIELQINSTVTRSNFKDIFSLYNLCIDLGIKAWHVFAFVPVGCGVSVPEEERLSANEYEEFLIQMAELSLESKIEIKVTCAPHYQRILAQKAAASVAKLTRGCLAGSAVCFISSKGEVYPCGYLPISAGNVLKEQFTKIWRESQLLQSLRNTSLLKGRCAVCEYVDLCSGCRGRAYAAFGDYLEEEPDCIYQPLSVKS